MIPTGTVEVGWENGMLTGSGQTQHDEEPGREKQSQTQKRPQRLEEQRRNLADAPGALLKHPHDVGRISAQQKQQQEDDHLECHKQTAE